MGSLSDPHFGPRLYCLLKEAPFRGSFSDPKNGSQNSFKNIAASDRPAAQVLAFLQWTQWLFQHVHRDRQPIVLNMDETSIARATAGKRGYVIGGSGGAPEHRELFTARETRGHSTLAAVIAADHTLQHLCVQLVLTRDTSLCPATRAALRAVDLPLKWMQGTAGWTNGDHMVTVLTEIRRPFQRAFPERPVILFIDAAAQHVSNKVLAHANRLRMQLVLIPAALTWLLQPLDTHVFSVLKRKILSVQQALRAGSLDGRMGPDQWVAILHEAVRDVIQRRDWQHAFAGNGLLGDSGRIRNSLLEDLGSQLPLPLVPPTDEQLCAIVGRHRVALSGQLLNEARRVIAEAQRRARTAVGEQPTPVREAAPGSAASTDLGEGTPLRAPRGRRLGHPASTSSGAPPGSGF